MTVFISPQVSPIVEFCFQVEDSVQVEIILYKRKVETKEDKCYVKEVRGLELTLVLFSSTIV